MFWVAFSSLICALVPAALFCVNLRRYRPPRRPGAYLEQGVSVLIPARNEAVAIEAAVRSVLRSSGLPFEVIVMDDASEDDTRGVVQQLAREDARVRLELAPALPAGWNGKQHACWALAQKAQFPLLCFVDADVRLEPACVASMAAFLAEGRRSLVSGFPRQVTETRLEWLLLPLIHFVLLGFLPLGKMRKGTDTSFSAGCGQFMMVRRDHYFACGGHSGIRLTMHDGLRLPRLLREHGFRTDIADLTNLANCRMYSTGAQVWSGLAKNATEGLGDPRRIGPVSLALFLGQVLPFAMLAFWSLVTVLLFAMQRWMGFRFTMTQSATPMLAMFAAAVVIAWLPRWLAVFRFRQDWRGALLHPVGIVMLLAVQWYALARKLRGSPVSWRNRAYAGGA